MKAVTTEDSVPGKDLNLGIVTPFLNERDNAEAFVARVFAACADFDFESVRLFAVLDNACTDGTVDLLRGIATTEARLRVVWAPENRSVADAYRRGYREALAAGCDWILEIDAGFSHLPEQIPAFFGEMARGRDCVFGVRFGLREARFEGSSKRKVISLGGTWVTNLLLGTRKPDMTSGFALFGRKALSWLLEQGLHARGPFFQTEIRVHAELTLDCSLVPIRYATPSHTISCSALFESFSGLWRLFRQYRL